MNGSADSTHLPAPNGVTERLANVSAAPAVHLSRQQLREARGPFRSLDDRVPEGIGARGDLSVLDRRLVGLFCSRECPPDLSAAALEMVKALSTPALAIASGFHSPVERSCLDGILSLEMPAVLCLGRAVETAHLSATLESAVCAGRLLLLSHFSPSVHRLTTGTAARRNRLVAALADDLLIIHASPGGKIEALCQEAIIWGKRIFTLESEHNARILSLGARPLSTESARLALVLNT